MSSEPFDQADQAAPAGLGDRLDDLLLRVEAWVATSRTTVVAIVVLAIAAGAAWLTLSASSSPPPVEASIPLAQPDPVAGDGAGSGEAGGAAAAGGAGSPTDGPQPAGAGIDGASDVGGSDGRDGEVGEQAEPEELVVHVVGAVRRPGLVRLASGDRISDAVNAAGGGQPDADLDRLNLASLVVDGMQIRVPSVDESGDGQPPDGPLIQLPVGGTGVGGGAGPDQLVPAGPIDLNRADEVELQRLPGIGPALAARIAAWRADNGGFTSVDELEAVPGIGPAKLAGLRDLVTI